MTLWHSLVATATVVFLLAGPAGSPAQPKILEDRMIDLEVTPLDPAAPPPLDVVTTTGVRVSLADVKGQAALVYFWATW
jgi:cytochrome oxidase Cu insertion factor (SCO1/SenC/PrrC family)